MTFATNSQALADRLLAKFDERRGDDRIMLIRKGAKTWNETTREFEFAADTMLPLIGVAVPYKVGQINNTTIMAGDIKLTVTRAHEVTTADQIKLDNKTYSVVSTTPFAYTGTALNIAYALQLR